MHGNLIFFSSHTSAVCVWFPQFNKQQQWRKKIHRKSAKSSLEYVALKAARREALEAKKSYVIPMVSKGKNKFSYLYMHNFPILEWYCYVFDYYVSSKRELRVYKISHSSWQFANLLSTWWLFHFRTCTHVGKAKSRVLVNKKLRTNTYLFSSFQVNSGEITYSSNCFKLISIHDTYWKGSAEENMEIANAGNQIKFP